MTAPIGAKCLEGLADMALQGQQHQLDRPRLVGRFAPIFWDRTGTARAPRMCFRHISNQVC